MSKKTCGHVTNSLDSFDEQLYSVFGLTLKSDRLVRVEAFGHEVGEGTKPHPGSFTSVFGRWNSSDPWHNSWVLEGFAEQNHPTHPEHARTRYII